MKPTPPPSGRVKFVPFEVDREREHLEERKDGRDWWRCVPTTEAYLLADERERRVREELALYVERMHTLDIGGLDENDQWESQLVVDKADLLSFLRTTAVQRTVRGQSGEGQ